MVRRPDRPGARHQRDDVKAHLTKIYGAIGAADRISAALWAHRNGVAAVSR